MMFLRDACTQHSTASVCKNLILQRVALRSSFTYSVVQQPGCVEPAPDIVECLAGASVLDELILSSIGCMLWKLCNFVVVL